MSDTFKVTEALADEEIREAEKSAKEHSEHISKIVLAIEDVLLKENASWGHWHEVIGLFNERAEAVVPRIKISALKKRFDKITN